MRSHRGCFLGGAVVCVVLVVCFTAFAVVLGGGGRLRLPVRHSTIFDATGIDVPRLMIHENRVWTDDGHPVVLRGVMVPDPAVLAREGRFRRGMIEDIAAAGANVVRVPVHPEYWRDDPDYLWRYLDEIVRWCGQEGMYAILDWHSIGNVVTGRAPLSQELYSATEESTREFWSQIAAHFESTPHVLFEVFNEPQGIAAEEWRDAAQALIGVIRGAGATQPVIVGGLEYARDLSWVLKTPLDDAAVIYASHIYPSHPASSWDTWFGDVALRYPVMITEWGFLDQSTTNQDSYLVGSTAGYGAPLIARLDALGAGWVACWWDDTWVPVMFTHGMKAPTEYGQFVLERLSS